MNSAKQVAGETKSPVMVPMELIEVCRHRLDAIRLCIQLSNLSNEAICGRLGLDPGHFTRMMHGRANFPDAKSVELMWVCGNYAPLQWEAMACGFDLSPRANDARVRALEAEILRLKGAA